ncbi:hypothetical protein I7I51_08598 [Histoplasma capsulatum]|uniref:Uncharacterized protein n=1 Tax=Ajellomyces capsulatus TaxID=5037 RepID=A0A8A1LYB4_AJECA|nr:hypothetical protein I7I51_08598 [Histoplasma capsulatum]
MWKLRSRLGFFLIVKKAVPSLDIIVSNSIDPVAAKAKLCSSSMGSLSNEKPLTVTFSQLGLDPAVKLEVRNSVWWTMYSFLGGPSFVSSGEFLVTYNYAVRRKRRSTKCFVSKLMRNREELSVYTISELLSLSAPLLTEKYITSFHTHWRACNTNTLITTSGYKPPHKLTVGDLCAGLRPMGFTKGVVRLATNPNRPLLQLLVLEYRVRINEGLNTHATNGLAPGLLEEHCSR